MNIPTLEPVTGASQPADLAPVAENLSPIRPGDRVALPDRPITDAEGREYTHKHNGMYGIVQAVGLKDGQLAYELRVFDPATGVIPDEKPVYYRARLEELQ